MDAKELFQLTFAVVVTVVLVVLIVVGVHSVFRYFWPVQNDVPSLVEKLKSDIETINSKKDASWQVQEADVEVFFSAKASGTTGTDKNNAISVTSESGTERGNKLTLRLRRNVPTATVPNNLTPTPK